MTAGLPTPIRPERQSHTRNLRIQLDGQVLFSQGLLDGGQIVVGSTLDGALPLEVDNHCTLLGLECVMTARGNQALNDVVKSVVIVIEQDQMPFVVEQDLRQDIFLSFNF